MLPEDAHVPLPCRSAPDARIIVRSGSDEPVKRLGGVAQPTGFCFPPVAGWGMIGGMDTQDVSDWLGFGIGAFLISAVVAYSIGRSLSPAETVWVHGVFRAGAAAIVVQIIVVAVKKFRVKRHP